jgi:ribosomal-protein-alanine N-acetyltransferase
MAHDYLELTDRLERAYSRRLALRRVSLADAWPLFEATRNPLFNKHLLWDQPERQHDAIARMDAIVEAARRGRLAALSGVLRATGEWASLFRFQPYAADPEAMEMGIWTHDRFWAGRFSLELGLLCVDAVFDSCDVDRLIGAAAPENRGSCFLMRSVGMSEADLVRRPTESGRLVTLQEFELLRSDWEDQVAARAKGPAYAVVEAGGRASTSRGGAAPAWCETRQSGEAVDMAR